MSTPPATGGHTGTTRISTVHTPPPTLTSGRLPPGFEGGAPDPETGGRPSPSRRHLQRNCASRGNRPAPLR